MPKVLINAVSAKSGGAAIYYRNLASELAKTEKGYCILCVPPVRPGTRFSTGDHLRLRETYIAYRSPWRRLLWDQFTLRRIVKKERIGVLLSSSDFGMLFPPCPQILMIRNSLFFSPYYLEKLLPARNNRFQAEFLLRRQLVLLSIRSSDLIITASQSMLNDLRRFVSLPDGRAVVNPFGVPLERFMKSRPGSSSDVPAESARLFQVLFVSEYGDHKNLTTLLRAVQILRERGETGFRVLTTADPSQFPEVEMAARGDDRALASHPLVASALKFTGRVPYDEIPDLYQQSDLFVFPSLAESFGHPLVEAMASGLAVVASDIPICREICGDAAVYFDPLQPEELAERIATLRGDCELRRRLGERGRKRAETQFEWKEHVRRLLETVDKVAAKE